MPSRQINVFFYKKETEKIEIVARPAQYQMSYGFDNEGQSKPTMPDPEPDPAAQEEAAKKAKLEAEAAKSAKSKQKPTWFEDDSGKSTKVYITGLPLDMNEEKLGEFVSKCGVVDVDIRTNKPKLKLYRDANNQVWPLTQFFFFFLFVKTQ